jgi:hypothetical protein
VGCEFNGCRRSEGAHRLVCIGAVIAHAEYWKSEVDQGTTS